MDEYVLAAQEQLLPLLNEGAVRTVITRTPGGYGASDDFNSGAITVFLKPWEEREKTTQDVVDEVNRRLATLPTVRGNAAVRSSLGRRSEEHTSELQSLMSISYAVFCLKKK